jgi:CRP-like cAMP-binding protein
MVARDLGDAELRLAGLLDKTAHRRISESLVYLKLKHPDYTWTRKEIGEYSGSTPETVTRVMRILERKNIIKKHGRDFEILNNDKLLSLKEEDLY